MLNNILGTVATRFINAVASFVIVILVSRWLGADGLGSVNLVVLGISIAVMASNFVGGGALVYLVPRHRLIHLLLPAYVWAVFTTALVVAVLHAFELVPARYSLDIYIISLIHAFMTVHQVSLLGKERILKNNLVTLTRILTMVTSLLVIMLALEHKSIDAYVQSLYISYSLALILSTAFITKEIRMARIAGFFRMIHRSLRYGMFVQLANIIQLFNYRLAYFLIDAFHNRALLGVFSVGIQISEGVWLISRSIAMVQYSRIANISDSKEALEVTRKLLKFTLMIVITVLIPLLLLPSQVYVWIFGEEFDRVRSVILLLSPGILAVAINSIFSHFFSGTGRHHLNAIGAGIGLVFTLGLGFLLIPPFGILGAAITATLAYWASFVFQLIMFLRISEYKPGSLLPDKTDLQYALKTILSLMKIQIN